MRFLFHRRARDLPVTWKIRPWWRAMSLDECESLLWALSSTFSLVLGVIGGVVLLAAPGGSVSEAAYAHAPVAFVIGIAVNLLVACFCWARFLVWLKERRDRNLPLVRRADEPKSP